MPLVSPSTEDARQANGPDWDYQPDYPSIMRTAHAMMQRRNYQALFEAAMELEGGAIVEIGPSRGASTIFLALAAKHNPAIERVISIDAFKGSASLKSFDDVETNVEELRSNLACFDCADEVTIMVADQEDWGLIDRSPISFLFIDADGRLDRDFSRYYNRLAPHATVFIDDCELMLNVHAKGRNIRDRTGYTDDPVVDAGAFLERPAPLGKEYLTKCFVEYLVSRGFLTQEDCFGKTLKLKKADPDPVFSDEDATNMTLIHEGMRRRLLAVRADTMRIARKLEPVLMEVLERTHGKEVVVLSSIKRGGKVLYYPIYGVSRDGRRAGETPCRPRKELLGSGDGRVTMFGPSFQHLFWNAVLVRDDEGSPARGIPLPLRFKLGRTIAKVERETQEYIDNIEVRLITPQGQD